MIYRWPKSWTVNDRVERAIFDRAHAIWMSAGDMQWHNATMRVCVALHRRVVGLNLEGSDITPDALLAILVAIPDSEFDGTPL